HYSLLTTHYSLLTTHYSLLTTHYSLLTTHYSLLTTHYSLLTTHYSLLRTTGHSIEAAVSARPRASPLRARCRPSRGDRRCVRSGSQSPLETAAAGIAARVRSHHGSAADRSRIGRRREAGRQAPCLPLRSMWVHPLRSPSLLRSPSAGAGARWTYPAHRS